MNDKIEILLVDDEERFIDGLMGVLDHYEYSCARALTGSEARQLLQEREFDIALLDVGLPDMSGCDLAEFITTSCPDTSAIMLTGLNTVETAVQAMKQGAYDFLAKPINHEHLLKVIDKAVAHNRLRKDLRLSEARFEVLAEAGWEGIAVVENDLLVEGNSQFFKMFGYLKEEIINQPFPETVVVGDSLLDQAATATGDTAHSSECTGLRKNGSSFKVEVRHRSMDYLGRPARIWVLRDISERVRNEEEKLALQEKLARANRLEALGLMAGSVAHDLNNILTAVVSYPEILLKQMREQDPYYLEIKKIQEAGKRAAAVVADLVSVARGKKTKPPPLDLNDQILSHLDSIEHNERLSVYPGVVIDTGLKTDLQSCLCSAPRIHKILLNLIGNGLEAIGHDGIIRISTENCRFANPVMKDQLMRVGNYVKMTISDNGEGISAEDLEHIFDPFYSTKKSGRSGTGLGLAIVWNSVMESDGWVEAVSDELGTRFEVYLPASGKEPTAKSLERRKQENGGGETILLVDDETAQNQTMQEMLGSLGYKAFCATTSDQALGFLRSCRVDLVILDMLMEGDIDGVQLYRKILDINPEQKALVVSGYSESGQISKAKALGITTILEKPVTLPVVSRAIRHTLEED
ncbi:MAG: response regulator [Desulfocapsaceae bacterium]